MHKLLELEKEYENLDKILVEAIRSESILEKQEALSKFNASELIKYEHTEGSLMVLAQEFGVTARLIKIAKTLPGKIEDLKAKARTLEYHLEVGDRTPEISEYSKFNTTNQYNERGEDIVSFDETSDSEDIDSIAPKTNTNINAIEEFKKALQPYIETTHDREGEYHYGKAGSLLGYFGSGVETLFGYHGVCGYSKTEKLTAITKLFQRLEDKEAPELSDKERSILTTGELGKVVNPWLDNEYIGSQLTEILINNNSYEKKM